jgi:Uma2 family endonuclease
MTQIARNNLGSTQEERAKRAVPPLENGDHLTRDEFERRYDAMRDLKRAELINGVVYMSPPVSTPGHGRPHFRLSTVFGNYVSATPGTDGSDNSSVRLDLENMPQPDLFLMILASHGGQAKIDEEGYLEGSPELIAEIAATSASYDLHEKLKVYQRSGVREYLVWRTLDQQFDLLSLNPGNHQAIAPDAQGILRSQIFPGLWIDSEALFAGDLAKALATLQTGLASNEHAVFAPALKAKAANR